MMDSFIYLIRDTRNGGFGGKRDLNGWLLSPHIVICLLCMVQNIHWYGFSLWEPLLYVQQRAQGSWLFTRW